MISIPNSHFYTITTKQEIEFYSPRDKLSYTTDLNKLHFIVYLSILNSTFTSILPTRITWFYFTGHGVVFCTLYFGPVWVRHISNWFLIWEELQLPFGVFWTVFFPFSHPANCCSFQELKEVLALLGALDLKVRDLPPG